MIDGERIVIIVHHLLQILYKTAKQGFDYGYIQATSLDNVLLSSLSSLVYQQAYASGQFYGGSMSHRQEKQADGSSLVIIELITGWVLGKGPCGAACSRTDIGRSTRSTRQMLLSSDPGYLGQFILEQKTAGFKIETRDIDATVNKSYNETVFDVDENTRWEQEKMHFSVLMEKDKREIDIIFKGYSWRDVSFHSSSSNASWYFQTKIVSYIRSDTNKTNSSPKSLSRPIYRIALDRVSTIHIPVVDAEEDFIKCELAKVIEAGIISINPPPNVIVYENCTISINASQAAGYTDNSWIAVAVSVRDYNRRNIQYGTIGTYYATYYAGRYSLSTTLVQFTVRVFQNIAVPKFVEPTSKSGHTFIIYADSTWSTEIYAKASANTTIETFKTIGILKDKILNNQIQQDPKRQENVFTKVSWKPTIADIGEHIACFRVTDNNGVNSQDDRCFLLHVRPDVYNYSSNYVMGKPYFVNIPSPHQMVNCTLHTTCLIPMYIVSSVKVNDIQVTDSFIDKYHISKIQNVSHKGQQVYQAELQFESFVLGNKNICMIAKDIIGTESENVCITTHIDPKDACMSAPCKNSATCVTDTKTGSFKCICQPRTSGKICQIRQDPCSPDPCITENTLSCYGQGLCYCRLGFSGRTCETNINDCPLSACNDYGMCKDGVGNYTCECFERFSGVNCTIDKCPAQRQLTCPEAGCSNASCNSRGVCSAQGHCTCPYGYYGHQCETPKCDITGTSTGIISPSVKDGSRLICYLEGGLILQCALRVYVTGKSSFVPTIDIETSRELQNITTVGDAKRSQVIPGISTIYTIDITISGKFNSSKFQYICVVATYVSSKSSICYDINILPNPEQDATSLAYLQRQAKIKFIQPTIKDASQIICRTWERCQILLYTGFASNRSSCHATNTTAPTGTVNGNCDTTDRDNDEDDIDLAGKLASPCCENVVTSSAEVKVFSAHPRGPSCVTEVSAIFDSVGENDICFHSASFEYQKLCYTFLVYANDKRDPCSSSPCQNNGHCFRSDQDNYKCVCQENYVGDYCQTGPCQSPDNHCQNDAYCQVHDGVTSCICKAGFFGPECSKGPSSLQSSFPKFTDTAEPTFFFCFINQICSFSLVLTSLTKMIPRVSPGYVESTMLLEEMKTFARKPIPDSFQTDVFLRGLQLGVKDFCIQAINTNNVNKDELCMKVHVVSDASLLYSYEDRPHFLHPSLPNDAEVKCLAGGPCHVLYDVTPGNGNENECVTIQTNPPAGFVNYHLFSSCDNCTPGNSNNGNCTVDISVINNITDNNTIRRFCLSVGLKSYSTEGEERCFNIHVIDPNTDVQKGCQTLECINGGFCDGHDPASPVCFCHKGFTGRHCELAKGDSQIAQNQTQSLIGDLALPSEIKCVIGKTCGIPFQIVTKTGIIPMTSVGYNDPHLNLDIPMVKALGKSTTIYQGQVIANPDAVGNFKFCLQVITKSKTDDEICVNVTVASTADEKINKYFPYFLPPTLSSDGTVLCSTGKTCHFDMHFTSGDQFGYVGRCPSLSVTSENVAKSVHVFDIKRQTTECYADVAYLTPSKVGEHQICLQVSLPGKNGEIICYNVKVVTDIRGEVSSPCRGEICANNGNCVADLKSAPFQTSCDCKPGFSGPKCETDELTNSTDNVCFSCEDLIDPSFCDTIEHCHSNQICFVESYSLGNGKIHYRSGCKDKQICNQHSVAFSGTTSCLQCCENSFCNSEGCGGLALPPRHTRGPLCLDCARVKDPVDCDQIAFCSSGESCSIEKLKWGDAYLYHLGCESTPQCSFETNSMASDVQFETRSIPVCRGCCHDDFCNRNCTTKQTDTQQIFVG